MTVSYSQSGSVSAALTVNSGSASVPILVKEDVYKGNALVGTTYRNITFSSSSSPNPNLPNNVPTLNSLIANHTFTGFGTFQTQNQTFGASSLSGPNNPLTTSTRFRVTRSTNAGDPLPIVNFPIYNTLNSNSDSPALYIWVVQPNQPFTWSRSDHTGVITGSYTGSVVANVGLSGFSVQLENESGWPTGLSYVKVQFNIPVGTYLDLAGMHNVVLPTTLKKRFAYPSSVYQSNLENASFTNDPKIGPFNPSTKNIYMHGTTNIWTFRIPTGNRVGALCIQAVGNFKLFNQTSQVWEAFTGSFVGDFGSTNIGNFFSEFEVTNYSTTTSTYQEVKIMENSVGLTGGRVEGFSYLEYDSNVPLPTYNYTVPPTWLTGRVNVPLRSTDTTIGTKIEVNNTSTQVTLVRSDNPADTIPVTTHMIAEDNVNDSTFFVNITPPATNGIATSFTAALTTYTTTAFTQTVTITPSTTQVIFTIPPRGVYGTTLCQIIWAVPYRASWTSGTVPRGLRVNSASVSLFQGRIQTQIFYRAIDCFVSNSNGILKTDSALFDQTTGYWNGTTSGQGITIFKVPRAIILDFNSTLGPGSLMMIVQQGMVNFYLDNTPTTDYFTGNTIGGADATTLGAFAYSHKPSADGTYFYFRAETLSGSTGLIWGFSNIL